MQVTVFCVAGDVAEVRRQGLLHPMLGAFLDGGSYAHIDGMLPSLDELSQIVGQTLKETAEAAGVTVYHAMSHQRITVANSIQVVGKAKPLKCGTDAPNVWYQILANGSALSWVIIDRSGHLPPLWVLFAHSLPCMGPIAPVAVEDVWATWIELAGGTPVSGRFLLEEPTSPFGSATEVRLIERLRQLYGE